jgi:DNA polymerase-3 subunit alpha
MNFVHLNTHSNASILHASARVTDLVDRAKELGQKAIALTDYSNMYSSIDFYAAAKKAGIKPIMGIDLFFCENCEESKIQKVRQVYHLTLIAENNIGWKNINRLVSEANNEVNYFYRPRIDFALLEKYSEGVIMLTGGMDGIIPYYLHDKIDSEGDVRDAKAIFRAEALIRRFISIFGTDRLFLEVQNTGQPQQKEVNKSLRKMGGKYGLRTVATGNVHYVHRHDAEAHKTLLDMNFSAFNKLTTANFEEEEFFLKDADEMIEGGLLPEELECSAMIAERCDVEIDIAARRLPAYEFLPEGKTAMEHLRDIALKGYHEACIQNQPNFQVYADRMKRELADIEDMGFADYFLIVHDVVTWAYNQEILMGRGRGSAGGSLTSYLLGITDIDPIEYGLIWERFLNKGRGGLPDIDTDFPRSRRQEVLDYIRSRFGEDKVAQLVTFNTLQARAVLKDVFKVYDMPFAEANAITRMVPEKNDEHSTTITIEEALEKSPPLRAAAEKYKAWFEVAKDLYGCYRGIGMHPSAVVISDKPLSDSEYPLTKAPKNPNLIFGLDMGTVDRMSLLKLDILGLNTLDDIQVTRDLVEARHNVFLDRNSMPLDDGPTYSLISSGLTTGVFQIEKQLGKVWSKALEPRTIEEISDLVSIIRPGPLDSGMGEQYKNVKRGDQEPSYVHPKLESILKDTFSACLYQEQVIKICQELAGMSLIDADKVRKAMGKKKPEEMQVWKEAFVTGCGQGNVDIATAEEIWGFIETFAGYGFNKSHGVGYALLAYETAYLKAHYTVEFLCAKLRNADDSDKLVPFIHEARLFEVEVTPPRLSAGNIDFDIIHDHQIAFGLSSLKGAGKAALTALSRINIADDKDPLYSLLRQALRKGSKISTAVITGLIKSGALDDLELDRVRMLSTFAVYDGLSLLERDLVDVLRKDRPEVSDWISFVRGISDEDRQLEIKERYGVRMPTTPRRTKIRELLAEYDKAEIFDHMTQKLTWEREYLGIALSGDGNLFKSRDSCKDVKNEAESGMFFEIAIQVETVSKKFDKNGNEMAFLSVSDDTYALDNICVFNHTFKECESLLEEGNILRLGCKMGDRGSLIVNFLERV